MAERKNKNNIMSKSVIQYEDEELEAEDSNSDISIEPDSESEEVQENKQLTSSILENPFDNIKPSKAGKYYEYRLLIYSEKTEEQLEGTRKIREILTTEHRPPVQDVIDSGLVPCILEFLERSDSPQLQLEAAWVITNIASGTAEHVKFLVNQDVVPKLIHLLASPDKEVQEQALWALGNIAGDGPTYRDLVLQQEGVVNLLILMSADDPSLKLSYRRTLVWMISNLCRGKPHPDFGKISQFLPTLARFLLFSDDVEILVDTCWALSYISDRPESIQAVLDAGCLPKAIELLGSNTSSVVIPALRAVGNIATGSAEQTQALISNGVVARLLLLLGHQKKNIRKEACWTFSNITAGSTEQIQAVIEGNVFPQLRDLVIGSDSDVRKEAVWAILNIVESATVEQINYVLSLGCITPIIPLLNSDVKQVMLILDGFKKLAVALKPFPEPFQNFKGLLLDNGLEERLADLVHHDNLTVRTRTTDLQQELGIIES